MIDLNDVDSVEHTPPSYLMNETEIVDHSKIDFLNESIKSQYKDFENMGTYMILNTNDNEKAIILGEMLNYVNDYYNITIVGYNDMTLSRTKTLQYGDLVYQFIVIDCYNSILPHYLSLINCIDLKQFDAYMKNTLNNDISNFKTSFFNAIKSMIDSLRRLSELDTSVLQDEKYKSYLHKYIFYSDLINFGDSQEFLYNYLRPMFYKNEDDIIWRLM